MSFLCLISLKPQRKISEAVETEIKCPVAITEWEAQCASEVFLLIICHRGAPFLLPPPLFSLKTQVGWVVVLLAWRLSAWWLSVGVGLQTWLAGFSWSAAQPGHSGPAPLHQLLPETGIQHWPACGQGQTRAGGPEGVLSRVIMWRDSFKAKPTLAWLSRCYSLCELLIYV